MPLVKSVEEVEKNIRTLHAAVVNNNHDAIRLIRKGKSIVVANIGGNIIFGPSRFLGYRDNDIERHMSGEFDRDGKETNPAIKHALGFDKSSNVAADSEFLRYCGRLNVKADDNQRQYWVLPGAVEFIDLNAVRADPSTNETEKDQLYKARLGQGQFRSQLDQKWGGCCITGCKVRQVLRASHIKPWRHCDNQERLDADNGLLLIANIDALFDSGLISFDENGYLIHSDALTQEELRLLIGCSSPALELNVRQAHFMESHRKLHGFERARYNQ